MSFYERRRYDAIIVLANLMSKEGELNKETQSRVDLAVRALKSGCAPLLVTCGWAYRQDSEIRIADAMRNYAIERHEANESSVIVEAEPRDTVGDALFTKLKLASPRRWSDVLIVTSDYHAERALCIFSFVYGSKVLVEAAGAVSDNYEASRIGEAASMAAFLRTFEGISPGDDSAIYARLREQHPYYNGQVHQKIPARDF
jgi:uncharacterized SAM-binding protein YcdF (DUF218 family)